ncbi:MAG: hypothetical protein QM740_06585 [Acidovorax sp.]
MQLTPWLRQRLAQAVRISVSMEGCRPQALALALMEQRRIQAAPVPSH